MPQQRSRFNEATRVQMPALVHLTRIGYKYFGKIRDTDANTVYDPDTNILLDEFKKQFAVLNPGHEGEAEGLLQIIRQELDNDDIGESFYKRLTAESPVKLVDFRNPANNSYYCTAEFTCKRDEDEFRPDITLFVNGLPLAFIEVKKPNNPGGIISEANRMNNQRFPNRKFRRFINLTQLMIFSNNMEYDTVGGIVPVEGAFYCTAAKGNAKFNCFREENPQNLGIAPFHSAFPYEHIDYEVEKKILSDFNNQVIHTSPEYQTNLEVATPTNRILTSMCSPERLLFLLKYGIAYYHKTKEKEDGSIEKIDQKHIMRYQQMFAALKVRDMIDKGGTSGIIWHTQGSGKTALSFHLSHVLTDYLSEHNKVAKFYFVVDRLDLLKQAKEEFEARGLVVKTANSRDELMKQFRNNESMVGNTGEREITVVNIQRFKEDKEKVVMPGYATNLQRIFIIDEAHRGYKPEGSFLMNLMNADRNAYKIALTGTPLLKEERESWRVFGDYIHTYYYDKSVQDGYTLKIMREDIETSYRERLSEIYDSLEHLIQKKDVKKEYIIEHENYVKELLRYVISDLKKFRELHDKTVGGMIICETSEQARRLYAYFDEVQHELNQEASSPTYMKAGLILYDSDDKETRETTVKDFKDNFKIDILIVFNMLLTGFDAPRLKRLYFGRKLKDHNLLQAITRVNRPYTGDIRYGYVVDFADIKQNFEQTNEAYLRELNRYNDPEEVGTENVVDIVGMVLEKPEELVTRIMNAKQALFNYQIDNAEVFNTEVATIEDKEVLLELRKALVDIRDCYNVVKSFGNDEIKEQIAPLEIPNLRELISVVQACIRSINQKEAIEESDDSRIIINEAMQDITFNFSKIGQEEMKMLSDGGAELNDKVQRTVRQFTENIDHEDPEYVTIRDAFFARLKASGFQPNNLDEYYAYSRDMEEILKKLADLQKKNNALMYRYNDDKKFARVHKRIREENEKRKAAGKPVILSEYDDKIVEALKVIKNTIDQKVYDKNDILKKDAYFEQTVMTEITNGLDQLNFSNTREDRVFIQSRIAKQYLEQYKEFYPAA